MTILKEGDVIKLEDGHRVYARRTSAWREI